ncbi:hypothetical protein [Cohnella laeviribosi]|nr:hypothetical protein [Cohnella laeviribosi]
MRAACEQYEGGTHLSGSPGAFRPRPRRADRGGARAGDAAKQM